MMSGSGFSGSINSENDAISARIMDGNMLPEPLTNLLNSSHASVLPLSMESHINVNDLGLSSNPVKPTHSTVQTESDHCFGQANYNTRNNDVALTSNNSVYEETNHVSSNNKTSRVGNNKATTSECHPAPIEVIDLTNDDSLDEISYGNASRLTTLQELLPDEDITFLKHAVDMFISDDNLQSFVSYALERQDYPKNDNIKKTDNNSLLLLNRQVEGKSIVNSQGEVDIGSLTKYSVPHSAEINLPHTVTSTAVQETDTPRPLLANPPATTYMEYTQPLSFLSVPHTVSHTMQQNYVQLHPNTVMHSQSFTPVASQSTHRNVIGPHSRISFSKGHSASLVMNRNNGIINIQTSNLRQPMIVHELGQTSASGNSHENRAGMSTVLPETNDKNYKLISDILFWVDCSFLEKDIKNLKSDDDVDMYLIRALCEEGMPNPGPLLRRSLYAPPTKLNNKYKILSQLLPDASPRFLKKESANILTYGEVYKFVIKHKQEESYPKRKDGSASKLKRKLNDSSKGESTGDMKYQILKEMLPDADPDYLLKESKVLANDADIEAFVIKSVEGKSYPKHDEFLKRQEFHKQWRKYIEDFKIKEFLQLFPNPIRHFYIEKVNSCTLSNIPVDFLHHRYRWKDSNLLFAKYQEATFSLTKTCDRLDRLFYGNVRNYSKWDQTTTFSTSVLQEIAFIQNKKDIAYYMLFRSQRKTEAYDIAKAAGLLQECGCCYDENLPEDMSPCGGGHMFCMNCIKRGSEVIIGNGGCSFPCYSDDCNEEFSLEIVKAVLNPEVFARMMSRKQFEEVNAAGISGLETCSFCEFCSIPAPEDKLFHCLNPLCMKITCRKCRKVDHLPLTCEEFIEKNTRLKIQSYVEDKMTEALVRTCWKCGKKFVKESGCNLMTCKCGAKMCYVCRQPVQDYTHFQGGRCGQYIDTTAHDTATVVEAGKKARLEAEAANPGFHLANEPTMLWRSKRQKH